MWLTTDPCMPEASNDGAMGDLGLGFSVVKFAGVLMVQTVVWCMLCVALQHLVVVKEYSVDGTHQWKVCSRGLCEVYYFAISFCFNDGLLLASLIWGTHFMNLYLRLQGATVEGQGRMLCLPRSFYDLLLVIFAERWYRSRQLCDICTFRQRCNWHSPRP